MLKRKHLTAMLGLTLGLVGPLPLLAQTDASDSQRVGNMQFGNSLDPTGWGAFATPDPVGMSYLHPNQMRTPTGALYPYPHQVPDQAPLRHGRLDVYVAGRIRLHACQRRPQR